MAAAHVSEPPVDVAATGARSAEVPSAPAARERPVAQPAAPATPATVPSQSLPADVAFQSGDDVLFGTATQVEVPDIGPVSGEAGTISFWLAPDWMDDNQDDATFVRLGDALEVMKNVHFLRFEFTDQDGVTGGVGVPIGDWKQGEWHQVTSTWSGGQFSMFVDGELVGRTQHDGAIDVPPGTPLDIGSGFPPNRRVAPGVIGQLDVLNRPMTPDEVAHRFADAVADGR